MDATTRQCANRRTPTLKALLILFLCAGLVGAWVSVFPTWALADEPAEEGDAVKVDEPELTAQADDFQGNIWLDGENWVFSDSSLTMHLQHQGIEEPYVLHVYVGRWGDNPAYGELLNQGEGYTYNAASGEITLDGEWLFKYGFDNVRISAQVWYEPADATDPDTDWHLVKDENRWIEVRETRREYDREQDRDLLPGQDGFINGRFHAYVRDANHPDGMDIDCEVTDVQIISGEWLLQDFRQDNDGEGRRWYYRAGNDTGTVELKVIFQIPESHEDSYTFKLNVSDNAYDIRGSIIGKTDDLPEGDGSSIGLPGQDIKLKAQGVQLRSDGQEFTDGFTYDWEIVEGGDCAHVDSEMVDDASIATVHFEDYSDGDFYHRDVKVRVTASKDGTSTEHEFYLEVSNEYPEIWIEETNSPNIDSNMAPGGTQQVTPQVRYHKNWSSDFCHIENIRWIFDSNKLKITFNTDMEVHSGDNINVGSPQAPTFTLERLNGDDCDVEIQIDWRPNENQRPEAADENGLRHESMRFHLDPSDQNYDFWFENDRNQKLYSDSTTEFRVGTNVNENDNVTIEWMLGHFEWENNEQHWLDILQPDDGYEVTGDGRSVILDGAKLSQNAVVRERGGLNVVARLVVNGHEVRSESGWAELYEPTVEYEFEQDRDMLPGWEGSINGVGNAHVEDERHPGGEDLPYEVIEVQVISGNEHLQDFHPDSNADGHWWYYRAGSFGTVTFEVTYKKLDDTTDSYTFNLNISGATYDIETTCNSDRDQELPGSIIEVWAKGVKHTAVNHDYDEHYDYADTTEGLDYEWEIEQGEDVIRMDVDQADHGHVTLHIADMPEGENEIDRFVVARVKMLDEGQVVRRSGWAFNVRNDFCEPHVEGLDHDLVIGATQDATIELRHYVYGQGDYTVVDNAQLEFDFDSSALEIIAPNGETVKSDGTRYPAGCPYFFRRLKNWRTDVRIRGIWSENGEDRSYDYFWNFRQLDYDLWFDENKHDIDLWVTRNENGTFSDFADVTNTLVLSDTLEAVGGLAYEWTVGTWENDCWDQIFGPDSGLYTISGDGKSITSNVAAMAEQGVRNLRVSAAVNLGGEHLETHNDFWFHLREREDWFDREQDRDMLPGDTNTVFRWYNHHLCNEQYPDGFNEQYEVIDVTTSDDSVVSVERQDWGAGEQADHNWRYSAQNKGTATLTVFYQMPGDAPGSYNQDSYTFDVHVGSDVYIVQMWSDDDAYNVLPGSTVEIHAQGMHRREGQPDTDEGLTYNWEIVQGADVCKAPEVDSTDPKHVTVRIKTPAEAGKMGFDDDVTVRVHLNDGSNTNVAESEWHVRVANVFQEIYPTSVDSGLCVGKSEQVKLELRQYLYGQDEFTTIGDAQFSFRFDGDCISITDEAGNEVSNSDEGPSETFYPAGTYTVTRKGDWNTNVNVHAIWAERNEIRDTHRDWWFERPNQEILFTADEYKTNENCAAVVKLDVSSVSHIPDYADSMAINIGNIDTHTFEDALTNPLYSVSKGDSVWTITIPGAVLAEKGCSELVVDALFNMKGEYSLVTGNETRVSLTNDPTHIISHVNATAPTPTKDGVKEHYCCDNCGATFADEAGTQPVSMDDLAIVLAEQVISVTNKSVAMGKTVSLNAKVTTGSGKLSYKSFNNKVAKVDSNGVVTPVSVGKTTITVTAAASGNYKATSKNVTVTVTKGVSPIIVKAKAVKAAKDKKTTVKKDAVFTIKNAKGKVTFKKIKGDKKIVVKKNGTIIVKKGLTKKSYTVKVKVTDSGNTDWKSKSKTITLKVKVK